MASARHLATEQVNPLSVEAAARFRIIPVGFYHARVGPEWSSGQRTESDQLHHVDFVVAGSAQVCHGRREFTLLPGTCHWLPGNTPVTRTCSDFYEAYFLSFRCEWINGVDMLSDWPERCPALLGKWDIDAWKPAWERSPLEVGTLVEMTALVTAFLARHLHSLNDIIAHHAKANAAFSQVFEHLVDHGKASTTVAELAEIYGATPAVFAHAFTRAMGVSPKVFLQRRLNQEACTLLRASNQQIKAIAAQLGFNDALYFSRWFTQINHLTPGKYRRSFQQFT